MSTDRDIERIARSWLQEEQHEDANRVVDIVLDLVDTTPQRRPIWPVRRFPHLNTYARFGLVAAALVLVAVVGIGLFGKSVGGPSPVPTPSSTASATPVANRLAGTWLAAEVTCAQQIATIEKAGFTAAQATSAGFDPTCARNNLGASVAPSNRYSVVFDGLPVAATIRGSQTLDRGAPNSTALYRITSDTTFELGGRTGNAWEYCLTFHYAIAGDQLTINSIDPRCSGTGDAPLIDQVALTAIFETSPFTRQP